MWQADTGGCGVCAAGPLRGPPGARSGAPVPGGTMYAATMAGREGVCTGAV